jgi:hypothetical protein
MAKKLTYRFTHNGKQYTLEGDNEEALMAQANEITSNPQNLALPPSENTLARSQNEQLGMAQKEYAAYEPFAQAGQIAMQAGASALTTPASGIAGLFGTVAGMAPGGESPSDKGARYTREVQGWGFQPKTAGAQEINEVMAQGSDIAINDYIRPKIEEITTGPDGPNPLSSAALETAIFGFPEVIGGVKGFKGTSAARAADAATLKRAADLGLDLDSPRIVDQLGPSARDRAVEFHGENIENLLQNLRHEHNVESMKQDTAFEQARAHRAEIRAPSFRELSLKTARELIENGFDFWRMPDIQGHLKEWLKIGKTEGRVRLGYIQTLRERLKYNTPPPGSVPDSHRPHARTEAALTILKERLDEMVQKAFDEDMIVGDPEALAAWRNAYEIRQRYVELFDVDRTLHKMVFNEEATGAEVRKWIFGASSVGARPQAIHIIERLNTLLGKDSPAMQGLRMEFTYDVVEPLIDTTPNIHEFIRRYERTMNKNRQVVEALDPYRATQVDQLYDVAKALQGSMRKGQTLPLNMNRILSQALFGHDIAQAAMKRTLAETALVKLRGMGSAQRRKVLQALGGYDPNTPLMPKGTFAAGALMADWVSQEEEQRARNVAPEAE